MSHTIYLVRHGQAESNLQQLFAGWNTDPKLTETGIRQAQSVGVFLSSYNITGVWVSPLSRARQTAAEIAEACDLPITTRRELIEVHVGTLDGQPMKDHNLELFHEAKEIWLAGIESGRLGGNGESLGEARARVKPLVEELKSPKCDGLVVVSHYCILQVMLNLMLAPDLYTRYQMRNAAASILESDGVSFTLKELNIIPYELMIKNN